LEGAFGLGCSPFFLKYRFAPKLPADDFLGIAHTTSLDEVPFTPQPRQCNIDRMKRNYDLKHVGSSPSFQIGDHIFVRKDEGHLSKMFGPVTVTRIHLYNGVVKALTYRYCDKLHIVHVTNCRKFESLDN
jgi:hypothetical protein